MMDRSGVRNKEKVPAHKQWHKWRFRILVNSNCTSRKHLYDIVRAARTNSSICDWNVVGVMSGGSFVRWVFNLTEYRLACV